MTFQAIFLTFLLLALTVPQVSRAQSARTETAIFAGGCFWCMEEPFESRNGIISAVVGYTGGLTVDPTYEEVCTGKTGHLEAVKITYDPSKITYTELLDIYWKLIDPTDPGGQFVDRGSQYKTAIFYQSDEQKRIAENSKEQLNRSGIFASPVVTEIRPAETFYVAEGYHQNYYRECPIPYKTYSRDSGRVTFLDRIWGDGTEFTTMATDKIQPKYSKPSDSELRDTLTPLQFEVTQNECTENPFNNEFWDNKQEGIYVDVVTGEPLFSSTDKYDSDSGWPSFTKPLEPENIVEKSDRSLFMERTEIRSKSGDSHLGHVFDDGPAPTGLRYCLNSAALRFIPREDMEQEGYGEYLSLFK